jgi:hypothetical protein
VGEGTEETVKIENEQREPERRRLTRLPYLQRALGLAAGSLVRVNVGQGLGRLF